LRHPDREAVRVVAQRQVGRPHSFWAPRRRPHSTRRRCGRERASGPQH
jgi:hypothetical protein